MKRLGRVIVIALAAMLAVCSLQAAAEAPLAGRDFNHNATGFPLTGVHALAACETCHAGGVFKGTPRICDGCHALGKRIVATPKSTGHIVTDAPCETCHFNASTFLGARFNHGTALPGQCSNCHNGRQSLGKPASHSSGNKLTKSCDQCHRSYTWFNASWNHDATAYGRCTECHIVGGDGTPRPTATHTRQYMAQNQCDDCHIFLGWSPAVYKHIGASTVCTTCHNGTAAVTTPAGHMAIGTDDCDVCHTSTATWSGALGAKPAKHIPYNAGAACGTCHIGTSILKGSSLHAQVSSYACYTCHGKNTAYSGQGQQTASWPGFHESSKNPSAADCSANGCHRPAGTKGSLYTRWD